MLGHALYGLWIGVVMSVALVGAVVVIFRLPGRDPESGILT